MKESCNFYHRGFSNNCSILIGKIKCENCKFYLTKSEYEKRMEYLKLHNSICK